MNVFDSEIRSRSSDNPDNIGSAPDFSLNQGVKDAIDALLRQTQPSNKLCVVDKAVVDEVFALRVENRQLKKQLAVWDQWADGNIAARHIRKAQAKEEKSSFPPAEIRFPADRFESLPEYVRLYFLGLDSGDLFELLKERTEAAIRTGQDTRDKYLGGELRRNEQYVHDEYQLEWNAIVQVYRIQASDQTHTEFYLGRRSLGEQHVYFSAKQLHEIRLFPGERPEYRDIKLNRLFEELVKVDEDHVEANFMKLFIGTDTSGPPSLSSTLTFRKLCCDFRELVARDKLPGPAASGTIITHQRRSRGIPTLRVTVTGPNQRVAREHVPGLEPDSRAEEEEAPEPSGANATVAVPHIVVDHVQHSPPESTSDGTEAEPDPLVEDDTSEEETVEADDSSEEGVLTLPDAVVPLAEAERALSQIADLTRYEWSRSPASTE